jgi:hypothetical protein
MPLVSNIGRSIPIVERLASVVRGAAGRARAQPAHAEHPFGATLYCRHETFGAEHYCQKDPFGGDLYLNVDSDLLS